MAIRSLAATSLGIELINRSITDKGWSREDLAQQCECSRQPSVKFCSGKKVSKRLFVCFCKVLGLDWEEIAGLKMVDLTNETTRITNQIDFLVNEIRQKVKADISNRCGMMRVLDMEQPIEINNIYTSVNILERLSSRRRLRIEELRENYDSDNFDRFLLGQVCNQRVPGLRAVKRYDKVMVLGKPGAGKTTFMKRLATLCSRGKFAPQCVPIFITLKEFSETKGEPDLQSYIGKQWHACSASNTDLSQILGEGRALILLDGLDEVQEADHSRVLQSIKTLTQDFSNCKFVMTCRIAAREYTFEQFTEVEVADFDSSQIDNFATKWFVTKQEPEKGKNFIKRLKDNKPIQELATNPLLLTLLCLVFGEANDFPHNRSELYKEGLDVLLKKWDAKRNIDRDQIYKKLSLKRKEDLLSQLAYHTFERGDYFFRQSVVEHQIIDYIRNLPDAKECDEALQLDSEVVLKSIEAQHGLLVERARGIYSFSHLTFQEYFTAKQIVSPVPQLTAALGNLATHCLEKRYREIFFLTLGMLPEADDFVRLIKQQVDRVIMSDPKLQNFLAWVCIKSESVNATYKTEAIRAYFLALDLARSLARSQTLDLYRVLDLDLARALSFSPEIDLDLAIDLDLDRALYRILYRSLDLVFAHEHIIEFSLDLNLDLGLDLAKIIELQSSNNTNISNRLRGLLAQIPDMQNPEDLHNWWDNFGSDWIEDLRSAMIEYRNIGHDWNFTNVQREKLQQYYDANKLLVECLDSDCYITKDARQEIESTLLLPTTKLENVTHN